jgi:hypothetical protein
MVRDVLEAGERVVSYQANDNGYPVAEVLEARFSKPFLVLISAIKLIK